MNEQRLKSDQNLAALKIQVVWRHLKKLRDFKESKKTNVLLTTSFYSDFSPSK